MAVACHRQPAPHRRQAPAPRVAGPGTAPRARHAAPDGRGADGGGVVRRRGARGDEDARHGVRVAAAEDQIG
jgi:hypothetical protein